MMRLWRRPLAPPTPDVPRMVAVRWRDTHGHGGGWLTAPEVADEASERVIVSVGWVLPWGTLRDHLSIATDYDAELGTFNGVSHLPFHGCVLSWQYLD